MFNDSDNGQTQYCSMCYETQRKLEKAKNMIYNYIYYNCDHYEDDNDCVNCNIVCWARDMEEVLFDKKIRGDRN